MSVELWLAFAVASIALLAIPGPTVMLVVSYALGRGRQTGWVTVPGVTLGDFTAMTVSLLGAGVILAASATLFTVLKLAGAAYLVWLGVRLWRANPTVDAINGVAKDRGGWAMFWNAFVVTALNPKGIVFFIAFVPQFVVAERALLPQLIILEITFLVLAAINVTLWAILAGEMRARFQSPAMLRITSRIGGCFLIGAGLLTAVVRRAS
jgi:threonine/homoserine/homoserine lactone efflux protein